MATIIAMPITPLHAVYVVIREICCNSPVLCEGNPLGAHERAYVFSRDMMLFHNGNALARNHIRSTAEEYFLCGEKNGAYV